MGARGSETGGPRPGEGRPPAATRGKRPYLVSKGGAEVRYRTHDVLVVGGGIAGLTAAVGAARRWNVAMLTKSTLDDTTTFLAQGGIAAALGPFDSPELHLQDTLTAGVGLCDAAAVRILVEDGPARVRELEHLGTRFDRRDGQLILASEGAHSVPRVVRAGGDATGSVVASALVEAMVAGSRVELHEDEFVIDLLTDDGRCVGALSLDTEGRLNVNLARAVVLACGGAGQVFLHTTNPEVATGDGPAMAYRAGAELRDMEFMQFHPTALHGDENPAFLLTEALRGEGAYLLDDGGVRFMVGAHPLAELAPRDVVVRRMSQVMEEAGGDHVFLDARHLDCAFLAQRFPTVNQGLKRRGWDLCTDLVPVSPASHYYIGGVTTDLWGRTSLPGLYACGETAATGVHGANRLASNSLLEGLVFGDRIVRDLSRFLGQASPAVRRVTLDLPGEEWTGNELDTVSGVRARLGDVMTRLCGVVRSEGQLTDAEHRVAALHGELSPPRRTVEELELFNLLTVASLMVQAARLRRETRGVHLRRDFSERDDAQWRRHITLQYDPDHDAATVRVIRPGGGQGPSAEEVTT